MVLIGDVDVVPGPHVIADPYLQVTDNAASLADQAAVTDGDHGIGDHRLAWHHARRQRDLRTEQRSLADVDELLVEERVRREANHTVAPESPESLASPSVRPDGPEFDRQFPSSMYTFASSTLEPGHGSPPRGFGHHIAFEHERNVRALVQRDREPLRSTGPRLRYGNAAAADREQ